MVLNFLSSPHQRLSEIMNNYAHVHHLKKRSSKWVMPNTVRETQLKQYLLTNAPKLKKKMVTKLLSILEGFS